MNRAEKRRRQKLLEKGPGKPSQQPASVSMNSLTLALALQHYNEGRFSEAKPLFQQVLQADPKQPVALHLLGVVAYQLGETVLAVDLISKALAIKPNYAAAHADLANILYALGKLNEAIDRYRKALAIKPDYALAYNGLGNVLKELGRFDEAVESYRKAVSIQQSFVMAYNNLGLTLLEQGKLNEAVESYRKALAIEPDNAWTYYSLGNALDNMGKVNEAVESYHKALAIKPDYALAYNGLGNVLKAMGKIDDAVESYRRALAIDPNYAVARRHLAHAKKHSTYDEDIQALEQAHDKPGASDEQLMHLAFGLGKAFEDLQQYDKAFDYFAEGNKLKRSSYNYSIKDDLDDMSEIKDVFNAELFANLQDTGCNNETPIFIVGMLRSGTSLVEQIIASHSRVSGAGELEILGRLIFTETGAVNPPEIYKRIREFDGADFEHIGSEYINAIRQLAPDAPFITDKLPGNFLNIGLIKLALPNAKIIHCKRDPVDICLSIYKNLFSSEGHYYAYDLSEIGHFYTLYREIMEHWHRVLPGFIYDIQYEDIVADQKGQTRALLEFCGLEWDDACMEFHKTERLVKTASDMQVRRPIYKSSVQLWKAYEKQLGPLLEILR